MYAYYGHHDCVVLSKKINFTESTKVGLGFRYKNLIKKEASLRPLFLMKICEQHITLIYLNLIALFCKYFSQLLIKWLIFSV